jgi:hypothetical protein
MDMQLLVGHKILTLIMTLGGLLVRFIIFQRRCVSKTGVIYVRMIKIKYYQDDTDFKGVNHEE